MSTYTIFPIEPPVSPSQLTAYRTLRLASLQIDPDAFSSTYAREIAFSDAVWRERLDSTLKQMFIASVRPVPESVNDAVKLGHTDSLLNDPAEVGDSETGGWIGTATVMGPMSPVMAPIAERFREAGAVGANSQLCGLVAIWVSPAHRNRGVGAQLVKACLEWVRTDVGFLDKNCRHRENAVILQVYDSNTAGRALYSRIGFTDAERVSAEEGERWMIVKV